MFILTWKKLAYTVMPFYDGFDKKKLREYRRENQMDDLKDSIEDTIDSVTKKRKRRK